ncbi:MAG: potassium transporter Trk [Candidatus Cloacimonetes bacterium]|nr:potassium transporter Trk [Candidatus Cloacimonadota bacterium]
MKAGKCLTIIDQLAAIILNLAALASFHFLFLNYITVSNEYIHILTLFIIWFLAIYLLIRFLCVGVSFHTVRQVIPDIIFIGVGLLIKDSDRVFQFYLLGRQAFLLVRNLILGEKRGELLNKLYNNPPLLVLFTFLLAIFLGTLMLMLPAATVGGAKTSVIGAAFTSTSATCVTGLIVYDTGTHFSFLGQMIILLLIQMGGLGIMTISSAFAIMLGQKISIKGESIIQHVVGEMTKVDMMSLLRSVIVVTFSFELLGAVFLYTTFKHTQASTGEAIYYAVFHSVSAFCNAGFSLFKDSFTGFRSSFNINFVITTLIIFGGIGFPVMVDLWRNFRQRFRFSRLSLHTKIVLTSTLVLIVIGVIGFFISEYNFTMKGFSLTDRIMSSYFQSVTTRTAGFNTIDNGSLSKPSVLISCILMFIGASPGSTGGGIKTTTLAVVIFSVLAMFKGHRYVNIFKRKISELITYRVMAVVASSLTLLSIMIFLLLMIEPFPFEKTLFEAFSAFGTVGLSMGITPLLSNFGKVIIIILMYMGRVGPLTLIFALSENKLMASYSYIEEKISIG